MRTWSAPTLAWVRMQGKRTILLVLSGLCVLAGLALGFLGFTGQQGVGFMGVAGGLCFALGGLGLAVALQEGTSWWVRTLLALCATLIALGCGGVCVLALTGKDFAHSGELWSLHASKASLCIASGLLIALSAAIGIAAYGIRTERTSDPLGPLDWNTQGNRYRTDLANGKAAPKAGSSADQGVANAAGPAKAFVPGHTSVAATERAPVGVVASTASGVPDGVLPQGMRGAKAAAPLRTGLHLPTLAIATIALLALLGGGGVWLFSSGPKSARANQAPITTAQTLNFPEWGFGFDVPGAPFEQIDPAQFSSRAVLAVTRKDPSMRFYIIAERRAEERTIEEAARLLREAMTDIAPNATTLLDNKAQIAGVDGWRLLTRVRVGSTDTFYCHWLGNLRGVSLQLWVVGTGRDAHSFAREADTLFDRFFVLSESATTTPGPATDVPATEPASATPEAKPEAPAAPAARPSATPATQPGARRPQPNPARPPARQPARQPATPAPGQVPPPR